MWLLPSGFAWGASTLLNSSASVIRPWWRSSDAYLGLLTLLNVSLEDRCCPKADQGLTNDRPPVRSRSQSQSRLEAHVEHYRSQYHPIRFIPHSQMQVAQLLPWHSLPTPAAYFGSLGPWFPGIVDLPATWLRCSKLKQRLGPSEPLLTRKSAPTSPFLLGAGLDGRRGDWEARGLGVLCVPCATGL